MVRYKSFLDTSVVDIPDDNEYCYTTVVEEAYVLVSYEQLNGIGNFYHWLLTLLTFHEITCSVDGEQLDHERNSGVLNSKNEVEIIDHEN